MVLVKFSKDIMFSLGSYTTQTLHGRRDESARISDATYILM